MSLRIDSFQIFFDPPVRRVTFTDESRPGISGVRHDLPWRDVEALRAELAAELEADLANVTPKLSDLARAVAAAKAERETHEEARDKARAEAEALTATIAALSSQVDDLLAAKAEAEAALAAETPVAKTEKWSER